MSSSRPDVVEDCLLEDLSQKPGSPDRKKVSAFSTKYQNDMSVYAKRYCLHMESLLLMFSTQGQGSELAELYWFLDAFSDEEKPAILKPYCDIRGPVLDDKACTDQYKAACVKEQREKLIQFLDQDTPTDT